MTTLSRSEVAARPSATSAAERRVLLADAARVRSQQTKPVTAAA